MNSKSNLKKLHEEGLYRKLKSIECVCDKYIYIDGKRYTNFTSNDYLGLGQLKFSIQDFSEFMKIYSPNLSSSRLVSGNSIIYDDLESTISNWLNFKNCLIFNSGYDANLSIFNIFKDEDILVFSDQKNHASIIDGIRLSGLDKKIYNHLDYKFLEGKLAYHSNKNVQKLIVSDSVFSTNGNIVNIKKLVELKNKYNAILLIDASHSLGLSIFENYHDVDVLTASLSKAWGAHGGIILSSNDIRKLMINQGRTLIYSSSLPIYNLYFIKKSLQCLFDAGKRREKLTYLSDYFNKSFKVLFPNQTNSASPIKKITFDRLDVAKKIYNTLFENGVFLSYLRYPTVEKPTLRISLSYFHDEKDIDKLLELINQYYQGEKNV
ncbi:aminotransferase class I/II-fold pyridoxal phosphate-dependent enzyme [Staphylococcus xylosus]|uniref:aminotransferase class I/II-fold pyridoxal phosphate-dependent enzyme n=1 Tax=Staphylococcus xylosus TaxID=1288 RepID=UPI003CF3C25A